MVCELYLNKVIINIKKTTDTQAGTHGYVNTYTHTYTHTFTQTNALFAKND